MSLLLTDGLAALGGTIKPTPRREEPVATGSSLTSCPYLATYKVVRHAGQDSLLPVVMLCRPGRKNKTEGLQYLEPKGNVLLGSPGELLTLRRHQNSILARGFDSLQRM